VHFKESATPGKDKAYDAIKKLNDIAFNLSVYNDDPSVDYAINGVPYLSGCEFVTQLKLGTSNPQGQYKLSFEALSSITEGYKVYLTDQYLQTEERITEETEYAFEVTDDPQTRGNGRFQVVFRAPQIDQARDLNISNVVTCDDAPVILTVNNPQPGILYQFTKDGQPLHEAIGSSSGMVEIPVAKDVLGFGVHNLNLVATSLNGCQSFEFADVQSVRYEPLAEAQLLE